MTPEERQAAVERILRSPSYRVAYQDLDFLTDPKLRATRMELELLKPELAFEREKINSTVVVFGSTRIVDEPEARQLVEKAEADLKADPENPKLRRAYERARSLLEKSRYYELARRFAYLVSQSCANNGQCDYVICTGGGPGIMEAANRGAYEAGAKSIGLNIRLPMEQIPNPYITPELCFQFRYFALRKFHFLLRAKALVVFPGGFGTLDELTDALTLRQTGRMQPIPIIIFGREYWDRVLNFQALADEGVIDDEDLKLFEFVETAEEAW
ncbi:MAG TPA: LOG family protein, partial [Thermogutta sp.]|nr:LOG family protein [Thermogutta sp.]